jgi:hypothetical protein
LEAVLFAGEIVEGVENSTPPAEQSTIGIAVSCVALRCRE